ncbi:MAG TPA: hypothetical protein VHX39_24770 [Acetobacteraceae bacterium]|jgi:hypothetical protein|nr:hypothetical protein [Acetobacteraceae bacterium]
MIGITTRKHRGFAIHIERNGAVNPPFKATIRRLVVEIHPRPGVFKGATEGDVTSQAKVAIERILATESA